MSCGLVVEFWIGVVTVWREEYGSTTPCPCKYGYHYLRRTVQKVALPRDTPRAKQLCGVSKVLFGGWANDRE